MTTINRALGNLFDFLLAPLARLPALAGLAVISLIVAVGMLLVYRATSNQPHLAEAKRRMQAALFEIRLFNDDLGTILRAQGDILRHNLTYLRLSLVPMLVMLVPLVLVMSQLQSYYEYRSLAPGAVFVLGLEVSPQTPPTRPEVQLRLPLGLHAETGDVWIPARSQLSWRLRADQPGHFQIVVQQGSEAMVKTVQVGSGFVRLSPVRQRANWVGVLLYPSEPPLPGSSLIRSIRVSYDTQDIAVFGRQLPWLVVFFFLVMAFAFLLRGRFRVTF
jgi:hypothetical protein